MTRIIIPTDFSANAMHAATYAAQLFGTEDATTYVLVHAQFDPGEGGALAPDQIHEASIAAQDGLTLVTKQFQQRTGARSVEEQLLHGALAPALSEFLEENRADLVVMGKRNGTGSALFGSNTTDVIKNSRVPVLAVPEKAPLQPVKHILLADDNDPIDLKNLDMLRRIALQQKADVTVTHIPVSVIEGEEYWNHGLYGTILKGIRHKFVEGFDEDVVEGLERNANRYGSDMIAVIHRHTSLLGRLFHASTAKALALEADQPVLVLQQWT
ncbi:MAG: universal stress protein [Flavobacteriales bacterium]